MSSDQDDFLKELLADFNVEASEHYLSIVNGLISLEKVSGKDEFNSIIERIFRETHSLKGAARAVNMTEIEKICMSMESGFNSLKKGEIQLSKPLMEAFHEASITLKTLLDNTANSPDSVLRNKLNMVINNLEYARRKGNDVPSKESIIVPSETISAKQEDSQIKSQERPIEKDGDTIRISSAKQIDILNSVEDFISIKNKFDFFNKKFFKLYDKVKDDSILDLANELVSFRHTTGRMIDDLIINIKSSLLLPFSSLTNIIPKIVWDLSKEYSKEISLEISGDSIEIDRRILEEIKDPLVHLIRNSIDHGIETPDVRIAKGKPAEGKISISIAFAADRKVLIKIEDNGAGIDKEKVIQSSIKNGVIDDEAARLLSDKDIFSLIFSSGISTKDFITDISGRGLGMAIVAEKVAKLDGSVDVSSEKDKGTCFTILLPQTIATFRGIVVSAEKQRFIIPSISLEKAIRIEKSSIMNIGMKRTINHGGNSITFLKLSDVLGITDKNRFKEKSNSNFINVLILNNSKKRMAFGVDSIMGEQEGIIKNLGPMLQKVKMITGVTIQGNGKVVPILEVSELFDVALKTKTFAVPTVEESKQEQVKKKILIAEDSITVRTMLRNFVENEGYIVKTAVDGMDAYNILMDEDFDLVVSDVEMPKMNGFELTEKIRSHNEHSDLPVVLVTALESAEDQKRGMEVGANAYIVKASFESSNLIETIKRFI